MFFIRAKGEFLSPKIVFFRFWKKNQKHFSQFLNKNITGPLNKPKGIIKGHFWEVFGKDGRNGENYQKIAWKIFLVLTSPK